MTDLYIFIKEARTIYMRRRGHNPDMYKEPEYIMVDGYQHLVWKNELGWPIATFRLKRGRVTMLR